MNNNADLPGASLLERIESALAGLALAMLLLGVFIDVLLRQLFSYPVMWLQEVSMFSYMWATFMGAAVAVRRNSHYRIDLIAMIFKPGKTVRIIGVVVLLICLVFAALLAYQGLGFAELGIKRVSRPSGIPLVYVFSALPICGLSMCFFLIEKLFKSRT